MKKLRFGGELMYKKSPVSCIAVCLILLALPRCGGESWETVCEFQDANLLFPNTPAGSAGDIRAKTWNKENGIRVASWMEKRNFEPNNLYGDRLMAIGENSIKIRNVTRFDSGAYTLVLISGSTQQFIQFTLHLEVLVPPTNQCIPNITQEVDALKADLPPDGCGIPMLTTKWIQKNVNIRVLSFESGLVPGMYTACAIGKSLNCFKGDVYKLCSNYTVSASQPQNESSVPVGGIIAGIIIAVIVVIICFVYWKFIRRKCCMSTKGQTIWHIHEEVDALIGGKTPVKESTDAELHISNEENEENSLMDEESLAKGVGDVKKYLIDQYKKMKGVALSACYEENHVDVSQVYCEIELESQGIMDEKGSENSTSKNSVFSSIDAENATSIPAMIIGECGSGKTTWCKNLVHQWCQYHDNKESNLDMKDLIVPDNARFEILLYIPLKQNLEGSSFFEHVRKTLFDKATDYYECTMNYILEHRGPVLILIDGLDEVTCSIDPIVNLLKVKEMVSCSIVLTSRLNGLEYLQEKDGISLRLFQICGMNRENSKEYASKVLDILSQSRGEQLNFDQFWKFAKHIYVRSMCHNPFLCLSLIFIWIESKTMSADLTEVLIVIVEYYLRRAMKREWYKVNIDKVLEGQRFDISKFVAKTKNKQCFRDNGYLVKVISCVAKHLWCLEMDAATDKKSVKEETNTMENENNVKCCLATGILMKTFTNELERTRTNITFSHPLLYDLFVAISITMDKGESFRQCIRTKKAVVKNSNMIHMLCQLAPNMGQELIKDISKIFEKDNDNDGNEKTEKSNLHVICNIERNNPNLPGATPVKWLKTLMCMDELSNAKLSILTEGLKFTKELTVFGLQLLEHKEKLIFRLPILPKLQALQIDIENCTLLLDEEREWSKGIFSELGKLVIKSVNMDVKTTGYIVEAISTCKNLYALELCPKNYSNAQILTLNCQKMFYGWGCLAHGIKDMTKLSTIRLHNLHIGEHMPAFLKSLCRCPTMEMVDIINLKEIDAGEILNIHASDQKLYGCEHPDIKQLENSKSFLDKIRNKHSKTLQLIKNTMSENSWLTVSEQIEYFSPHIVHIEQLHQSSLDVNELLQGIGRCKDLNVLSICGILAGNTPIEFSALRHLHRLEKLMLCKITMPDSSWKMLSEILSKLSKLKELSLAHLEIKHCFIEMKHLSKLKLLEMREVHLEEGLWSELGDGVMTLPKLEKLKLASCKMSSTEFGFFLEKMNHSVYYVKLANKSKAGDSEMLSTDMVIMLKKKGNSKDIKTASSIPIHTFESNSDECNIEKLMEIAV